MPNNFCDPKRIFARFALIICFVSHAHSSPTSGSLIREIGTGEIHAAYFSPDQSKVLTSGARFRLWDASTGSVIRNYDLDNYQGYAIFHPDGSKILAIVDRKMIYLNADTGERLATNTNELSNFRLATFSPDGSHLIGVYNHDIILLDALTLKQLRIYSGHEDQIRSLAFSPDGNQIASASWDTTARTWSIPNGNAEFLYYHNSDVNNVAYFPDGSRLITSAGSLFLWAPNYFRFLNAAGAIGSTVAMEIAPNGAQLALAQQTYPLIKTFSLPGITEELTLSGHQSEIQNLDYSADNSKLLSSSLDFTARIWDASTGAELKRFGSGHSVSSLDLSPDSTLLLTGGSSGTAKLWSLSTGQEIRTYAGHNGPVFSIQFSPCGTLMVTGGFDGFVKLWNVESGNLEKTFNAQAIIRSVQFSIDGQLIYITSDHNCWSWDFLSGSSTLIYSSTENRIFTGHFGESGPRLLIGRPGEYELLDTQTSTVLLRLNHQSIGSAVLSPDGYQLLFSNIDTNLEQWDVQTATLSNTYIEDRGDASIQLAFSHDGLSFLSSRGKNAKLWDTSNAENVSINKGHTREISALRFSQNGKFYVTGSLDGTVLIWQNPFTNGLDSRTWAKYATD